MDTPSTTDYTKTNINGLPATYVLTKNPNDPAGGLYVIAKVLDVPIHDDHGDTKDENDNSINVNPIRVPHSYMLYNYNETPLHLCDHACILTQYRCNNHSLQHRTIDISKGAYSKEEIDWYADPESEIPEPKRLVMIPMLRCFLCGDFQKKEDDIYFESSGQHTCGYRYCAECRPYFMKSLYKSIAPIIKFRQNYDKWRNSRDNREEIPFIWVARTRRDENGNRIVGGKTPHRYTKWRIINWVAKIHNFLRISPEDKISIIEEKESGLLCEQIDGEEIINFEYYTITKLVPLRDIYITNLALLNADADADTDAEYDPNNDDPLNKYSDEEQRDMFKMALARGIVTINVNANYY
jgi:hypothetical protein